jgi:hypothetical protein
MGTLKWPATARTKSDFPVPGGPYKSIPLGPMPRDNLFFVNNNISNLWA